MAGGAWVWRDMVLECSGNRSMNCVELVTRVGEVRCEGWRVCMLTGHCGGCAEDHRGDVHG